MVLPKYIWLKPHMMDISTHVAFLPQWFISGNNQTYVEMLKFCLVGLGFPVNAYYMKGLKIRFSSKVLITLKILSNIYATVPEINESLDGVSVSTSFVFSLGLGLGLVIETQHF